ncbi:5' nucleotidase, NT5C type [Streptomyces antibioticus]|uniref:5' nucleotidase, NT5C type n=1 Tax=Streptomyces antibioticus TaxID=1890 RepID=UPI003D74B993
MAMKTESKADYILGVDLDGVVADFYGHMRIVTAQWRGVDVNDLDSVDDPDSKVSFGLREWGIPDREEYERLHRWAVTQHDLFNQMPPIAGAPQALRRLSRDGYRIRIITHRLFIPRFHQTAVQQTVRWLDYHGVPYWDLCFMGDKGAVDADLYIEDAPDNIEQLIANKKDVVIYANSTNRNIPAGWGERVENWPQVEHAVRRHCADWKADKP